MPVDAKFSADFSGFNPAVQQAEEHLRSLSGRLVAAGSAVGSFAGTFAASAILQGIGALKSMATAAFESASVITDLSSKTGLTTASIQKMQFVAGQTGSTIDQFTNAAFQLGVRLSTGGTSVRQAVTDLGLSFTQLKSMRPDEQFELITSKLGAMENQTLRNDLGVALFGRNFANIAAAVAGGYGDIAKGARVSSDEQIKALSDAQNAWKGFVDNTKSGVTSLLGTIVQFGKAALDDLKPFDGKEMAHLKDRHLEAAAATTTHTAAVESYGGALAKAMREVGTLTTAQRAELDAATKLGVATTELSDKFGVSEQALRLYATQQTDATKRTKEFAAEQIKAAEAAAAHSAAFRKRVEAEGVAMMKAYDERNALAAKELGEITANAERQTDITRRRLEAEGLAIMQGHEAQNEIKERAAAAWRTHMNWIGERMMEDDAARLAQQAAQFETYLGALSTSFDRWGRTASTFVREFGLENNEVANDFLASWNYAGNAFSGVMRGMSGDITGWVDAAIAAIKSVWSWWKGISGLFGGGEEGRSVNPARDAFLAQFGPGGTGEGSGFHNLAGQLTGVTGEAGGGSLFAALTGATNMADYNKAIQAIQAVLPKFASGTSGFRDFGSGTLAVLHGRERVQTEGQARGESDTVSAITALRRDLRRSDDKWLATLGPILAGGRA